MRIIGGLNGRSGRGGEGQALQRGSIFPSDGDRSTYLHYGKEEGYNTACGIFLTDFCNINGMDKKELSAAANRKLLKYPYPGNVRELKAVIELQLFLPTPL